MEQRRLSKQVMERQRRARINASLNRLKELLQLNRRVDPDRLQRLEKADILELTVALLQQRNPQQQQQLGYSMTMPASSSSTAAAAAAATVKPKKSLSSTSSTVDSGSDEDSWQSGGAVFNSRLEQQQQQRHPLASLENHQPTDQTVWRPW
ncbi:hypothetical protein BOX15_Mlig018776g2 [Macrostomum lignano]|uniref:BHLH domain-containing protein n=1 Tax=Macrostomum lignano TaxID=282301 RepID=A0A267DGE6_9PLAT|nr:hypothetical protein BOX15_Mlig018776g2 [Macrostomum lignano]